MRLKVGRRVGLFVHHRSTIDQSKLLPSPFSHKSILRLPKIFLAALTASSAAFFAWPSPSYPIVLSVSAALPTNSLPLSNPDQIIFVKSVSVSRTFLSSFPNTKPHRAHLPAVNSLSAFFVESYISVQFVKALSIKSYKLNFEGDDRISKILVTV